MKQLMLKGLLKLRKTAKDFCTEENGEANIIAIILIIIVVIALVAIFRTQLSQIINGLFQQIKDSLGI